MFKLRDSWFSIAANVITDEGGSIKIQEYFTEHTAPTEEEAMKRAYLLGQRAIDQLE